MDLSEVAAILGRSLGRAAEQVQFAPLLAGIRESLEAVGIHADRIQIPMSRQAGFRHPTLGLVLLTWSREHDFDRTEVMSHAELDRLTTHGVVGTPFERVVLRREPTFRVRLDREDGGYPFLGKLARAGLRDYCAVGIRMPTGDDPQPMSLAAHQPFPDDVEERLQALAPMFALALYGVYRTSQAKRVAHVYIGRASGPRVLAGEIQRGSTRRIEAGIVFCDIRGFTALSERLGAEGVVAVVNEVFQVIGEEATARDGEILKFIGDAMLIVFPVRGDRAAVARAVVDTARRSIDRVAALAAERELPVAVGFGGHLGEVVQGNIGTEDRLDFTVMGPGVNLASRLEGLCKPLGASAVFSQAVQKHVVGLVGAGSHGLRGISEPVPVWTLEAPTGASQG